MIASRPLLKGIPTKLRRAVSAAGLVGVALCLLPAFSQPARAQAVPAATWPTGDTSPADQPLAGQMLGTDLTLNQGVNATTAENASFNRFGLGLSAMGGAETNFLGTSTNQTTAGFAQFTASAGLQLRTQRTRYYVLYEPQYNVYPQYPDINNFGQTFYQSLTHAISQRSGVAWDATAARYLSLNQYVPQSLAIGGVGIVVPTLGSELREDSFEITNVATNITYRYLLSAKWTATGTLTSGFFLEAPSNVAGANGNFSQRLLASGGDLQLGTQWSPRDTIGIEITPIYIYGIRPSGHLAAETVMATYTRQLNATWSATAGAGPLFVQGSSSQFGGIQETSYAANAGVGHLIRHSQLSAGYSRAFLINLLTPATVGNSFNFNANVPLTVHWIFAGAAGYSMQSGSNTYSGHVGGGSAQLSYQFQPRLQFYALYSVSSENFSDNSSGSSAQSNSGFTRSQFGGGVRFNLGNTTTQGGVQ